MNSRENQEYLALWNKFVTSADQKAFSEIYLYYYDLLFNYGLRYANDQTIIEDSIQNIFGYFLKVRKSLPEVSNLTAYLFKCFQSQLFLELKRKKKLVFPGDMPEDYFNYFNSPEFEIILKENWSYIREVIKICLSSLSPKQQEIIYLRFNFNFSYKTISDILGIDVDSCHKSIYRSIKAIRSELIKSGFDLADSTSSSLIRHYKRTLSSSRN